MIDRTHELPLTRQARVLKLSRSSLYYRRRPVSAADLAVMRRIDALHLDHPFAGSRMLRDLLNAEEIKIGREHVRTLMKKMGIEALYRRPNTSKPTPGHKIYPYLLRDINVGHPNQVWATDITYIQMARGFVYLVVVLDWFSRRVLSWRVSITLEVDFCLEAVEEALAKYGKPEPWQPAENTPKKRGPLSEQTGPALPTVSVDSKMSLTLLEQRDIFKYGTLDLYSPSGRGFFYKRFAGIYGRTS